MDPTTPAGHRHRIQERHARAARKRWAISIALSAVAHAGLLAWVTIEVPDMTESPRFVDRVGPLAAEPSESQRVIRVVQIKPPGVLPSGGAAAQSPSIAPVAVRPAAVLKAPMPTLTTRPAARLVLASAPSAPVALPSVNRTAGDESARPTRPNRGIVQRAPGGDVTGRTGRGSSGSSGRGRGGTGVTIVGSGTDCITAGLATPEGLIPLTLPNNAGRGAARDGGIGSGRIGRIGRIGRAGRPGR